MADIIDVANNNGVAKCEMGDVCLFISNRSNGYPFCEVKVKLYDANLALIDSATSDAYGIYRKQNIVFGKYYLDITNPKSLETVRQVIEITREASTMKVLQSFETES